MSSTHQRTAATEAAMARLEAATQANVDYSSKRIIGQGERTFGKRMHGTYLDAKKGID